MDDERLGPGAPLSEDYLRAHTVGELTPRSEAIHLVDYDPTWPGRFAEEAEKLRAVLGQRAMRIEHVGSTAVPGLSAKPILDILLLVADSGDESQYADSLQAAGYQLRVREPDWHEHRMFKGCEGSVNLHVFSFGCPEPERMLAFRDWLRSSASDRELYARTKHALAQEQWKYTQNYADAKTAVIAEIMARAHAR
jgi:GrpB-like predicted nucleotidyltransferase (UPF0157 family)